MIPESGLLGIPFGIRSTEAGNQFLAGNPAAELETDLSKPGELLGTGILRHLTIEIMHGDAQKFFVAKPADNIELDFKVFGLRQPDL